MESPERYPRDRGGVGRPWPRRDRGCRPRVAGAQAGDLVNSHHHDGDQRSCRRGLRGQPRAARSQPDGIQPAVDRDDRQAGRIDQGDRPRRRAAGRGLERFRRRQPARGGSRRADDAGGASCRSRSARARTSTRRSRRRQTRARARRSCTRPASCTPHARHVADAALKRRMPTAFGLDAFVEAGGLMSYGRRHGRHLAGAPRATSTGY